MTFSEDTLFLIVLTPGITKMPSIYESLTQFTSWKKKNDSSSRFNIIFFQEDGPNYLEGFTLNPDYIIKVLKSLEPVIVKGNIAGGILLAISIIINVFKRVSEKSFRLIILMDSGTLKMEKIYIPILEILIDQIKSLPFFIDIIKIDTDDTDDPEEDLKLVNLVKNCNGEVHQIKDVIFLSSILEPLALKREIFTDNSAEKKKLTIPKEDQQFFINLADIPKKIEKPEVCSICFKKNDKTIVNCPNCGAIAHKTCYALWAKDSSIGIPHVFRCHNCFYLIKLDKEFVESVKLAKIIQQAHIIPKKDISEIQEYLTSLEPEGGPNIIHVNDPMGIPSEDLIESEFDLNEKEFGDELDINDDSEINEVKFFLCPHCSKMITNNFKRCPNCHRIIQNSEN